MENKIDYKQPGEGAIEFAQSFTCGLNLNDAMPVIKKIMDGELHDAKDKRIKRCDYCSYFYRDQTRPNNSRTCSRECKINRDTLNRAKKRADAALLKPKKKSKRETYYLYWLEYPFWLNEYEMLKQAWKYEAPYSPSKIIQIDAAKQRGELIGGKRKPKRVVPYNGEEAEQPKVFVKYAKISDRKPGEVTISHMEPNEQSEYYSRKYTERHLQLERRRAIEFRCSRKV
ncbi:hypothetical protein [Peribacillus sp. TH14]|uniref:hypothetical protein n=1 Tax=Peribacillus sp. TH14 TaxID=2798481 RepID=UPI001914B5E3|nr:hypothetical protein [Peribacillus sp. TH14]MBK5500927.1 hypothetical protein [Peribacillus sp. TH14]